MSSVMLIVSLVLSADLACKPLQELTGVVVGVTDGGIITVLDVDEVRHKVRLNAIEAPEKKQAFGTKSKHALSDKIYAKSVVVRWMSKDRYGRILGDVVLGDRLINLEMVAAGYAWHDKKYDQRKEFADAEKTAKQKRLGLWVDSVPSWEY